LPSGGVESRGCRVLMLPREPNFSIHDRAAHTDGSMGLAAPMQAAQMEDLLGRVLRGKDAEVKAHPCIQVNVNFPLRSGPE
jgi:hypothetical protein